MIKLLNKELKLSINPMFHLIPLLTGGLLLIPQWVYFLAFMYFYWIAIPNILGTYNTQNDLLFSVFMPVKKEDIVKSKILVIMLMEISNILVAALFAVIHNSLFSINNFLFDLNFAFFGFVFVMNGIFNLVLFPEYFKTGHKIAKPIIAGIASVIIYAGLVELLVIKSTNFKSIVENHTNYPIQLSILFAGVVLFLILSFIAYKLSAKRFNLVEI